MQLTPAIIAASSTVIVDRVKVQIIASNKERQGWSFQSRGWSRVDHHRLLDQPVK